MTRHDRVSFSCFGRVRGSLLFSLTVSVCVCVCGGWWWWKGTSSRSALSWICATALPCRPPSLQGVSVTAKNEEEKKSK
jgi:hypothetical protein